MSTVPTPTEQLDRRDVTVGLFGILFLGLFIWMVQLANQFSNRAGEFPRLVLMVGIVIAAAIPIKRFLLNTVFPGLMSKSDGGFDEYLSGGQSSLTIQEKIKRMAWLIVWTVIFFILGGTNLFLAITVTYGGMIITFGIRDPKGIVVSIVGMNIFVYVVFVRVLNVPIGVF